MSKKENYIPDRLEALNLLESLNIPESVKEHSIKVAEVAMEITNQITRAEINKALVETGALLHDVGRSETHGFKHAQAGGRILRTKGFSEQLAKICETHILGGLDKDDAKKVGIPEKNYLPQTIEEKIICLADKRVLGDKKVSVDERFNKWFKKYGKTPILIKSKKRIEEIQRELNKLM